jgi:hypothetical protein
MGWTVPANPDKMNIAFRAGTGGLHPAENRHSRAEFQLSH